MTRQKWCIVQQGTSFMHKLYTPIMYEGNMYIAKISIEEYYHETSDSVKRKAYHLRTIKIEPVNGNFVDKSTTFPRFTSSINTVADLFKFVKQYDDEFKLNDSSKMVYRSTTKRDRLRRSLNMPYFIPL